MSDVAGPGTDPAPPDRMAPDEAALWSRWRTESDSAARCALIELHAPWSRLVARDVYLRLRAATADWSDYVSYATIGLIEAIDRYDPVHGVDFRTYARHRVRGAVFDGLRDFLSHPPGPDSGLGARVRERTSSLAEEGSDDPFTEIVSASIGLALGFLLDLESLPQEHAANDVYRTVERLEVQRRLAATVQQLPERERTIITLHYFQHVEFQAIAQLLGVTKGRVSQMHKRALERLREQHEADRLDR